MKKVNEARRSGFITGDIHILNIWGQNKPIVWVIAIVAPKPASSIKMNRTSLDLRTLLSRSNGSMKCLSRSRYRILAVIPLVARASVPMNQLTGRRQFRGRNNERLRKKLLTIAQREHLRLISKAISSELLSSRR